MSSGGWIASLDPRIVQSVASVATAAIASSTAIFIAVFVYARQKRLDAKYRVSEEIRTTCAKLVEATTSAIEDAGVKGNEITLHSVGAKLSKVNAYENLLIMQRAQLDLVAAAQRLSKAYADYLQYSYIASRRAEASSGGSDLSTKLFKERANFVEIARDQYLNIF